MLIEDPDLDKMTLFDDNLFDSKVKKSIDKIFGPPISDLSTNPVT